jgi:hypothetical protein
MTNLGTYATIERVRAYINSKKGKDFAVKHNLIEYVVDREITVEIYDDDFETVRLNKKGEGKN